MHTLKENIDYFNKEIENKNVKLIGVTKTKPTQIIRQAYDFGLKDFGENKVQELVLKIKELPKDIRWHFIGNLQTNKVSLLLKNNIFLIHSVDSLKLATCIDRCAKQQNKVQNILLEINVTGEQSKGGYKNVDTLLGEMPELLKLKNIKILGLMCVAKKGESAIPYFNMLKDLKQKINSAFNLNLTELSMGMTDDYKQAIDCGSTYIRIGRAIFGERE